MFEENKKSNNFESIILNNQLSSLEKLITTIIEYINDNLSKENNENNNIKQIIVGGISKRMKTIMDSDNNDKQKNCYYLNSYINHLYAYSISGFIRTPPKWVALSFNKRDNNVKVPEIVGDYKNNDLPVDLLALKFSKQDPSDNQRPFNKQEALERQSVDNKSIIIYQDENEHNIFNEYIRNLNINLHNFDSTFIESIKLDEKKIKELIEILDKSIDNFKNYIEKSPIFNRDNNKEIQKKIINEIKNQKQNIKKDKELNKDYTVIISQYYNLVKYLNEYYANSNKIKNTTFTHELLEFKYRDYDEDENKYKYKYLKYKKKYLKLM